MGLNPRTTPKRIHPVQVQFEFARNALIAVVLVRRTYKWVRFIRWNTETDEFEPGQWLHGDVYADSTSLSPDGELFHYLADRYDTELAPWDPNRAWTATSRPPFFTALAFWRNCGAGGGGFIANNVLYVYSETGKTKTTKGGVPPWLKIVTDDRARAAHRALIEKGIEPPGWQWESERTGNSKRPTYRGTLTHLETGSAHSFFEVQRLGWDHRGRVITAHRGCLYAWRFDEDGVRLEGMLADFNPMMPEPVAPPDWATHWPGSSHQLSRGIAPDSPARSRPGPRRRRRALSNRGWSVGS